MKYALSAIALIAAASAQSSTLTVPAPGAACTGSAYCAGESTPIILRCIDGKAQPGNCDDNLDEPPLGALCVSYAPAQASCSAIQSVSTPVGTAPIGTGTGAPGPTSNGTLTYTPTGPTASSTGTGPVPTGGAAGRWSSGAMAGAVVAVLGGIVVL
ncbi:MAG: hypothetical protein GOMPHAMPRED_005181 [Gomphillus americanus]|uniref:Uncharacterized protein n=1 Tax=Gomphillus americanus TaxID=1940652 RepID=A0A8H3FP50_9LECA|nr:MAG: hypothetical protein GOMPHAMPRED_005181 [Gomphillus americanus]